MDEKRCSVLNAVEGMIDEKKNRRRYQMLDKITEWKEMNKKGNEQLDEEDNRNRESGDLPLWRNTEREQYIIIITSKISSIYYVMLIYTIIVPNILTINPYMYIYFNILNRDIKEFDNDNITKEFVFTLSLLTDLTVHIIILYERKL